MSNHLMTQVDAYAPTPDDARAAARLASRYARDDAEAREFAQALGIIPTQRAHPDARDDVGRMKSTHRKATK